MLEQQVRSILAVEVVVQGLNILAEQVVQVW
jgi:hypothetical protein